MFFYLLILVFSYIFLIIVYYKLAKSDLELPNPELGHDCFVFKILRKDSISRTCPSQVLASRHFKPCSSKACWQNVVRRMDLIVHLERLNGELFLFPF